MIRIENLSKSFGKTRVLQQLSLNVNEGVFGILGNNGAGKTTLLKILATVLSFEQGTVTMFGIDVKKEAHEIRKRLGYLPQDFNFFPNMSLDFAMHCFADLKGMPKGKQRQVEIDDWLDQVNLLPYRKKLIFEARIEEVERWVPQEDECIYFYFGGPEMPGGFLGVDKDELVYYGIWNETKEWYQEQRTAWFKWVVPESWKYREDCFRYV